ncbi:MAG: phenylalanine--tRNA ligase subunit alpha [Bacteroidota bacterium]
MKEHIVQLQKDIKQSKLTTLEARQAFKNRFLSKEGVLRSLFIKMKELGPVAKKEVGKKLNALKLLAEELYQSATPDYERSTHVEKEGTYQDFSLPVAYKRPGSLHPITIIQNKITAILEKIGFVLAEGPEIEDEHHNFTALNIPENHPARNMQDTFFIEKGENMAMRTHTSSVQVRVLEKGELPVRIVSTGRVFRNETISARSHYVFHQIEGLYVNQDVSFIDLKETLYYLVHSLFGEDIDLRFRPSFFPFTEPSAEVDVQCLLCRGSGCHVCKKSGWLEIGGAGMVDPNVLITCAINPNQYTGYAFGIGIERLAMLIYQIPDIRLFTENDTRFLSQFQGIW